MPLKPVERGDVKLELGDEAFELRLNLSELEVQAPIVSAAARVCAAELGTAPSRETAILSVICVLGAFSC